MRLFTVVAAGLMVACSADVSNPNGGAAGAATATGGTGTGGTTGGTGTVGVSGGGGSSTGTAGSGIGGSGVAGSNTGGSSGSLGASGASSGGASGSGSGGQAAAVTCSTVGIHSCVEPFAADFYGCSEFYTTEAADLADPICLQLGATPTEGPCGPQFEVCCLHLDGSNDLPEKRCIYAADEETAQILDGFCIEDGHEVCPR